MGAVGSPNFITWRMTSARQRIWPLICRKRCKNCKLCGERGMPSKRRPALPRKGQADEHARAIGEGMCNRSDVVLLQLFMGLHTRAQRGPRRSWFHWLAVVV